MSEVSVTSPTPNTLVVSGDVSTVYVTVESTEIISIDSSVGLEVLVTQTNLITSAEQGPIGATGQRGIIGPEGPSGAIDPVINFSWGDATPSLLKMVPAGSRILLSRLYLDTPFNGAGAAVSLGTLAVPDLLWGGPIMDPATVATYEVKPNLVFNVDTNIYLFITPGSGGSQGSGSAMIQYQ